MKLLRTLIGTLILPLVLASCGGGGGGGGAVSLQPLVIDQNNAMQVSAAVMDVMAIVLDLGTGDIVPPVPVAAAVTEEGVNAESTTLAKVIRDQARRFLFLRTPVALSQVTAVVIPPTTFDCQLTGTFTISGDIADESGTVLTPGDTMSISFNNCDDDAGVVLNGTLALVVVTGVDVNFTPPYDFTFDTTMTNFTLTESGESFTANGDLTLREAASADGLFIEAEASGYKLTASGGGNTETLKDYWIRSTLDTAAGGAYTLQSGGLSDCCATLESTFLGGVVDFENTETFAGVGDNYPYTGVLFITGGMISSGTGDSSVELMPVDELCVTLRIDEDGDGGVDSSITTTWESLPTGIPHDCVV